MNVFFSTNFRNVKIDGSYLSMERMWDWLQRPVDEGGGADGLVTFNHPGGNPKLSPFDGGLPHTEVLAATGASNWNDVAYVPEVDERVVGMEINGGEDIEWLHQGADERLAHRRRSRPRTTTSVELVQPRRPQDADPHQGPHARRTTTGRSPTAARSPSTASWSTARRASPPSCRRSTSPPTAAHVLGSIVDVAGGGAHTLRVDASGLPAGSRVAADRLERPARRRRSSSARPTEPAWWMPRRRCRSTATTGTSRSSARPGPTPRLRHGPELLGGHRAHLVRVTDSNQDAPFDAGQFARDFQEFLQAVNRLAPAAGESLADIVTGHFGTDPRAFPSVTVQLEMTEQPNVQLALEALPGEWRLLGLAGELRHYGGLSLVGLLSGRLGMMAGVTPVEYVEVAVDVERTLPCAQMGVWLGRVDGAPVAILNVAGSEHGPRQGITVEVMAAERAVASGVLAQIRSSMDLHNVYRGKVLSFNLHGVRRLRARLPPRAHV